MNSQAKILSVLRSGERNAISLPDLVRVIGGDERSARKNIEFLRRSGHVILSSSKGCFTPETLDELRRYIQQKERKARSVFYTLKSARQLEKNMQSTENKEGD